MRIFHFCRPAAFVPGVGALLLLGGPGFAQAPALANNGALLQVDAGAQFTVVGDFSNASGTLRNHGQTTVSGDLNSAGTLDLGTGTLTLLGNLQAAGPVLPGTGTLRAAGAADQSIAAPGSTIWQLEVVLNGAAGANRLLLPADLTVSHLLRLDAGLVRTAASATLALPDGATLSGEAPGRYVQGNLRVTRAAVSGPVNFGHGFALDATGQALGTVAVTRTAGLNTPEVSFGQNGARQSIDRIWTAVATQAPTAPLPLTLSWLADDDHGLTDFTRTQLWQQPAAGQPWAALAPPADASARSLTVPTAALGRFTVSNVANPLPVQLTAFTAERWGRAALLRWATASEKNCAGFETQVSTDGAAFAPLGFVAGAGTSTNAHSYTFADEKLSRRGATLVYYRLRQVDEDGSSYFSPVRTVAVPADGTALAVYPVPARAGAALTVAGAPTGAAVVLHDALGREVARSPAPADAQGNASVPLPASLPAGGYLLRAGLAPARRVVVE